jgi:hypothetical protein
MKGAKPLRSKLSGTVTLKAVAQHLGLTPGTVSAVLINSRAARSIPENTRKRIIDAARELNYQPNLLARSLRVQRTFTVGVIAEEIGDTYGSSIVSGIEPYLRDNDFFFLTVAHRHDPKLLQTYSQLLVSRGVEGIITIDTSIVGRTHPANRCRCRPPESRQRYQHYSGSPARRGTWFAAPEGTRPRANRVLLRAAEEFGLGDPMGSDSGSGA